MRYDDIRREKGVRLKIRRDANATNGGISSAHDHAVLVGVLDETTQRYGQELSYAPLPLHWRGIAAREDLPPVVLVKRYVFGRVSWNIRPVPEGQKGRWFASGGNYVENNAYLNELTGGMRDDLPVHDRYEAPGS